MKKELEDSLFKEFSQFFNPADHQSLMIFGFEVGDGWYNLIRDGCKRIKELNPPKKFEVVQVKEKFGGLRFYTEYTTEKIYKIIEDMEDLSYKTCEFCGSTDDVRQTGGWIKTVCKNCREDK